MHIVMLGFVALALHLMRRRMRTERMRRLMERAKWGA